MVYIIIRMGLSILESGFKICKMDLVFKIGLMDHRIKGTHILIIAITKTARKMAKANSFGKMVIFIKDNLKIIKFKDLEK